MEGNLTVELVCSKFLYNLNKHPLMRSPFIYTLKYNIFSHCLFLHVSWPENPYYKSIFPGRDKIDRLGKTNSYQFLPKCLKQD